MLNSNDSNKLIEKSYQHFKSVKHSELKEIAKEELYKSKNTDKHILDLNHTVYNWVFWVTEDWVPLLTKLSEIDIPQFTYYSGVLNKNRSNITGTISTSNKVRLFDDTESSPITASIYNATYQEITSNFNSK